MKNIKSTLSNFEAIGSTVAFAILILLLVMITIDTYEFLHKPEDYARVYLLDITKENWQWGYLQNNISLAVISFGGIGIYIFSFVKKGNKALKVVRAFVSIILFGSLIYNYYQWYLTGFDH